MELLITIAAIYVIPWVKVYLRYYLKIEYPSLLRGSVNLLYIFMIIHFIHLVVDMICNIRYSTLRRIGYICFNIVGCFLIPAVNYYIFPNVDEFYSNLLRWILLLSYCVVFNVFKVRSN